MKSPTATSDILVASRARIVTAGDETRCRLERDLHDGAQQLLVALGLQTRLAESSVPPELDGLKSQLFQLILGLTDVSADLQEISRGIHPAILSKGGIGPALKTLARRSAVPVDLDLAIGRRLPDSVEVGAYYVVSEALTNAAKQARASVVNVSVVTEGANLHLSHQRDVHHERQRRHLSSCTRQACCTGWRVIPAIRSECTSALAVQRGTPGALRPRSWP